jgi:shikimate dehydrogenase
MTRLFGLIGQKLEHSSSQRWFRAFFRSEQIDADYLLFETDDLDTCVKTLLKHHPTLQGFNVTIPYKKDIIALCDMQSATVSETGAANCIHIKGGKMIAHNTDTDGFEWLAGQVPGWPEFPGALILGTGGAAAAVTWVLRRHNIPYIFVSRNPKTSASISYPELSVSHLRDYPLIINTTPTGMWPEAENRPGIPYELLSGNECIVDLIYNPEETLLMRSASERGCFVINGMGMLIHQAERSWNIWNG